MDNFIYFSKVPGYTKNEQKLFKFLLFILKNYHGIKINWYTLKHLSYFSVLPPRGNFTF